MGKREIERDANYRKLHGHDEYPTSGKSSFGKKVLVIIVILIIVAGLFVFLGGR